MSSIKESWISMKLLKGPEGRNKGAIILSQVDEVVSRFPFIKDKFYLIERRGWRGINECSQADIKLVEDLSYWDETIEKFPNSICLDIGPADFVDINIFRPLHIVKDYDGIQVSHWTDFKRPEMFVRAAGMLPNRRFLKIGHFVEGGSELEIRLRDSCIQLAKELEANIEFPYSDAINNTKFPNSKEVMNYYINKAKIGILTTKVEGINRFKMECLAAGIPVIASDVAGLKDSVGKGGVLVQKDNVKEWVKEILKFDNPRYYKKMSKRAKDWVKKNYSEQKIIHLNANLIRKISSI